MGRRARVTREQVLKAARETFSESGFDGATLTAIAAKVGVSPAALLRHAPTKEALFGAAMASAEPVLPLPIEFLDRLDGAEDPAEVLRRIAERAIPVLEATFEETIVGWLHSRRKTGVPVAIPLPFDPRSKTTPPQQAFRAIERYMRKAMKAGRIQVASSRAAATAFQGALFAYVSFHKLLRILDPPLPLDRYLDTLLEIWSRGAIAGPRARAGRRRMPGAPRPRGSKRRNAGGSSSKDAGGSSPRNAGGSSPRGTSK
jgi:AcrR family transcriptional regulator